MLDAKKREVMREAYQLLEKHETPNKDQSYWDNLVKDCNDLASRWEGKYKVYAQELAAAVLIGIENEYKAEGNQ